MQDDTSQKCQNATIVYDYDATPTNIGFEDMYPVKNLIHCQNDADRQSPRGTHYCATCWPAPRPVRTP
ncbi:hypothetical protein [Nonomuraea sp. NPDC050786]|uniref:hypothetical protein n=1 Tax=Nonomuraea sp. NPDC050786 TaxID=3154840 RepID=UPI0033C9346B